jgi:hypothetical protein
MGSEAATDDGWTRTGVATAKGGCARAGLWMMTTVAASTEQPMPMFCFHFQDGDLNNQNGEKTAARYSFPEVNSDNNAAEKKENEQSTIKRSEIGRNHQPAVVLGCFKLASGSRGG